MSRPIWFVRLVQRAFPSRFGIARLARRVPWIGRVVDHLLFRDDDIIYLPKDSVIRVNEPVEPRQDLVLPSQVVDHFVAQAQHLWIMDRCLCREADGCKDFPVDLGCLFMGEAVHKINPKLGYLATREEAHAHLARAREAGLVHLIGRNRIDTMWTGAGPYGQLMTVCNCCPCCCLWRVLPDLPSRISGNVTRMPGVSVKVTERCTGCGKCAGDVCFVDAIRMLDGRAVIGEACRGCGRCVEVCPSEAIELSIAEPSNVTQSIERLASLVDLG